jgi:hypothetical protein
MALDISAVSARMGTSRKNSAQKNKCEEILMNFKSVLVIATLVLSAGLTSCKGAEEAPKTGEPVTPAATTAPVEAPKTDAKPGDAMKPEGAKTDAKPGDAMKPEGAKTDAKPGDKKDAPKGDAMKPDATKKDEKKAN